VKRYPSALKVGLIKITIPYKQLITNDTVALEEARSYMSRPSDCQYNLTATPKPGEKQ
jgi:hypothetical protein